MVFAALYEKRFERCKDIGSHPKRDVVSLVSPVGVFAPPLLVWSV
jgi:hypothetical protein